MKSALFRGVSVSLPSASSRPMVDLYRLSLFFSCFHSTSSLQHPALSKPYPMRSTFFRGVYCTLGLKAMEMTVHVLTGCLWRGRRPVDTARHYKQTKKRL